MKPLVLTILPTRKCNLRCSYCKIGNQNFPNELNWYQWVSNIKKLNEQFDSLCFTVLLGGDITTWDEDLVQFVGEMAKTDIPYGFTTNGLLLTNEYLTRLKNNGLDSVSVSLDTMTSRADRNERMKSLGTIMLLPRLNRLGFKDLHCTVTVDRTNLEELPKLIKFLTSQNTYSEITPMLFGKNDAYDYTSSYEDLKNRLFTEEDKGRIDAVMMEIVRMKKEGYLIHNTDNYLLSWSRWGIKQQWKCGYPVGLVADADGSMRLCLQIKGKRVTNHDIGSLDFKKFLQDWYLDYYEFCRGCFWNCHYEAEYLYEKTGSVEAVRDYYNHNIKKVGE